MKQLSPPTLIIPSLLIIFLAACAGRPTSAAVDPIDAPTVSPLFAEPAESESLLDPEQPTATSSAEENATLETDLTPTPNDVVRVQVDVGRNVHPISPLIYGLSGASLEHRERLRPTLTSWGGNPSTRYNWKLGNAWNAGSDWFYRNGNYGYTGDSASDEFVAGAMNSGMAVRLAVPTLGWVAKNDNYNVCSFPLANGECGDAQGANCENPGQIADPELANVRSSPEFIKEWLEHLFNEQGFDIQFLAMDNEPELWGYTHYDVHPECTTYDEILERFLTYATTARSVAPEAEITGPVTCCWHFYWNSAAGREDRLKHDGQEFLPWFLEHVRQFDEANGLRTLDVLDIHYYPEGLYDSDASPKVAAHRLRSTRSLWDKTYADESWIAEPVYLIPRMKALIEEHYPGIKLGISEWNWGADETMNGALAIADVLGIFGREDLYFAAYWREPPLDSPGFYAFKLYTNYDDRGGRFGDTSVWAGSNDMDQVSAHAALDSDSGNLHLMLLNKLPADDIEIELDLGSFTPRPSAKVFQYSQSDLEDIYATEISLEEKPFKVELPAYSLTLLIIAPEV